VNLEFVPLSILDFRVVFRIWGAVRQCVMLIGFLGVGVGTNLEGDVGTGVGRGGEQAMAVRTVGGHLRVAMHWDHNKGTIKNKTQNTVERSTQSQ
jgi:hypothetical protein